MRAPLLAVLLAGLCANVAARSPLPPAAALRSAGHAVVTTAVADLLERPEPQSPIADQARLGDVLRVLPDAAGGYVAVETESGYRAFAAAADLKPTLASDPPYRDPRAAALLRVTSRLANVYGEPDVTKHPPLLRLPLGVALRADPSVAADQRWVAVRLPDGRRAYVQRGDTTADAAPALSSACVLSEARRYEGTPYLWGGRSTLGIDCSGLVSNAFQACGQIVPRDAGPQERWKELVPADPKQLRPGDLLFFGDAREHKVTHVGLYLGEGRFIHATTADTPTVHVSAFGDARWQQSFVSARRHPRLLGL